VNAPVKRRMTVPEFLEWGEVQEKGRFELVDGTVVAMSPERVRHVRAKQAAWLALARAIDAAQLPCEALADGITVVIDEKNAREPDALVHCGKPLNPDSLVSDNPLIIVEVLSPSSERSDTGEKLVEYFAVPSVRHYLIINPFRRVIVRHARSKSGKIDTRIVAAGTLELSPPGLSVPVDSFFA
jgi:Uma2 family endonuclease